MLKVLWRLAVWAACLVLKHLSSCWQMRLEFFHDNPRLGPPNNSSRSLMSANGLQQDLMRTRGDRAPSAPWLVSLYTENLHWNWIFCYGFQSLNLQLLKLTVWFYNTMNINWRINILRSTFWIVFGWHFEDHHWWAAWPSCHPIWCRSPHWEKEPDQPP